MSEGKRCAQNGHFPSTPSAEKDLHTDSNIIIRGFQDCTCDGISMAAGDAGLLRPELLQDLGLLLQLWQHS